MPSKSTPEKIPEKSSDPDYELVAAINGERPDLFPELVKRYEKRLYNFGMRICGNSSDVEDLLQETFINIYRYLKFFRYETKLKNWIYRIATSVCIKSKRRSKYAPEQELSLDDFIPKETKDLPSRVPDWATEPLEQVLNGELSAKLREAILALPPKYRLVSILRDVEGFSTEEAARILGITPTNVKVRLHRARLFVREKLTEYFQHEP
jgi:RNA polymerase sigma-70 factor, ECF subfamily